MQKITFQAAAAIVREEMRRTRSPRRAHKLGALAKALDSSEFSGYTLSVRRRDGRFLAAGLARSPVAARSRADTLRCVSEEPKPWIGWTDFWDGVAALRGATKRFPSERGWHAFKRKERLPALT